MKQRLRNNIKTRHHDLSPPVFLFSPSSSSSLVMNILPTLRHPLLSGLLGLLISIFTLSLTQVHLFTTTFSSPSPTHYISDIPIQSHGRTTQWSSKPVCTGILPTLNDELCVYTNTSFADGRGISIFTTPRIAAEFASLLPFHNPTSLYGTNNPEGAWYTQLLPNRGTSMLARQNLTRGDRITAFTPAFLAYREDILSTHQRERFFRLAVDQLPLHTREAYYGLATIFGEPTVIAQDVAKANTFEMQVGGEMHLAIFPEPARFNHDCAPNAQYYLDSERLTHYVHATREISQDEEITISYSSPFEPTAARNQYLLNAFHFTCTCRRCNEAIASDAALAQILTLQETLVDWSPQSTATVTKAEQLIQLYRQQGLEGFLDTAYGHATLTYNAAGNFAEAKRYARLAADALKMREGPAASDLGTWKDVLNDPMGHWSWGLRVSSR